MKKYLLLIGLLILFSSGCGGSDNDNDSGDNEDPQVALDSEFSDIESYEPSDFTLSNGVIYWEVTVNVTNLSEEPTLEPKYRFSEADYASLSEAQKSDLSAAFSNTGFKRYGCEPEHCPVYVLALQAEGDVRIVDSGAELAEFFGPIDTEAELHVYLWAHNYNPQRFEEAPGGYRAIVERLTCQAVITDLLFVDHDGAITLVQELEREDKEPPMCP